jgi:hypothetical protein
VLGGPQIPATLVVGGSIVENQSIKKELQKRLASFGALVLPCIFVFVPGMQLPKIPHFSAMLILRILLKTMKAYYYKEKLPEPLLANEYFTSYIFY